MRNAISAALLTLALAGCQPPPPRPFDVEVRAVTDENEPLPGAVVSIGGRAVGTTDGNGVVLLHRRDGEGARLAVTVEPPRGYKALEEPRPLVLHRIARLVGGVAREVPVEHVVRFGAQQRQYAVLVDVGQPALPVEAFGAQQAVTNSRGVASFVYTGTPGDELAVRVSSEGRAGLQPKVVTANFVLAQRSEAYLVQGRFEPAAVHAAVAHHVVHAPKIQRPRRL